MIGVIIFLIFLMLIMSATILIGMYIYYCAENKKGIFENPGKNYDYKFTELCSNVRDIKYKVDEMQTWIIDRFEKQED
ncbi:hypothetical protein [uncultured Eubacterium sp.]|uniref:hypothetical protein n=1 Tax=uncultured Eubacterium sp. TaxID=165185 RepID=UPI002598CC21|nr:hypothetical protein [uncultured Eubacterium sp.]